MEFDDEEPKNFIGKFKFMCREIYDYRVVLYALVRRNIAGRYKSTYVGFAWHLILPILLVVVLHITFTCIRPRDIPDYWIYLSAGIFPLTFMTASLRGGAILRNTNYMTKMYIPREIVVLADTITNFIGVFFAFTFIIVVILAMGQHVNWIGFAIIIPEMLLMFLFGLGCNFFLSTINVFVKDLGAAMGVVIRLIFYISPTFFFINEAAEPLRTIVYFNPVTYFMETFHQILYNGIIPSAYYILISAIMAAVALIIGYALFYKCKDKFAEVL